MKFRGSWNRSYGDSSLNWDWQPLHLLRNLLDTDRLAPRLTTICLEVWKSRARSSDSRIRLTSAVGQKFCRSRIYSSVFLYVDIFRLEEIMRIYYYVSHNHDTVVKYYFCDKKWRWRRKSIALLFSRELSLNLLVVRIKCWSLN